VGSYVLMYLSSKTSVASSREKLLASAFSSILTTVQSQLWLRVFLSQSNLILATKNIYSLLSCCLGGCKACSVLFSQYISIGNPSSKRSWWKSRLWMWKIVRNESKDNYSEWVNPIMNFKAILCLHFCKEINALLTQMIW